MWACPKDNNAVPARAVISWSPPGVKRKKQDINRGGFSWNDLLVLTADRMQRKYLIALCTFGMAGS